MQWMETLILLLIGIIFYNYAGYAVIAWLLTKLSGKKNRSEIPPYQPYVSFIVAAYNEEDIIEEKIANTLALDYPSEKLEIIFITDGSSDGTNAIIQKYPATRLLHLPERKGKSAALNRSVKEAQNEILIFSDANTFLNTDALKLLTRHYADPLTGGVSGEKKVKSAVKKENSEGLYWKYESTLKKIDADFYSLVGAAGELFSIRRELYTPVPNYILLDDFIISMRVVDNGYAVRYESGAYATEAPSADLDEEQKRKVRIAAGGFQAMEQFTHLYRFWKKPKLSFLYISHRVLRWAVTPFCLPLLLLINIIAGIKGTSPLFMWILWAQLSFYIAAILGYWLHKKGKNISVLSICYYFTFMNISVIKGFFRYLDRAQPATGVWEKSRREVSSNK